MTAESSDALLACAVDAVRTAGNHALRNVARRGDVVQTLEHDVKLQLDLECQAKAQQVIHAAFPEHRILGEEDATRGEARTAATRPDADASAFEWIVDPIDGTVNFSHGLPVWCCSVAVRRKQTVLAGAVYAPSSNELYTAAADGAAQLNGLPIAVSKTTELNQSLVFTGIDRNLAPGLKPFALFERIATHVQRPRISGSAALDICHVAAGYADGYFEAGVYLWDVAAAGLIVQRAGGAAEILRHQDERSYRLVFLATNGLIHQDMQELVAV